ncbi:MAG: peptide-methionine (S)-S-oxide reductase MsrA [Leptospirales bacterium]|nr:peptide-methionine (S)-S-oxide reductase MsrA [Leptospirales bacterium]
MPVLCAFLISLSVTTVQAQAGQRQTAVFGMGCFWCSEALYERFMGVESVVSGYAGGVTVNPNYEQVSAGDTGHAEVVQVTFDPAKISYSQLLEIFWEVHDPTTLNRQGADEGTQYRSVILYANAEQKKLAEASREAAKKKFASAIVTQIAPLKKFYLAEEYHQDYFRKHPNQPYCVFVISPKLQKLEKSAGHLPAKLKR